MKNKISLFTRFPTCAEVEKLKKAAQKEGVNLEIITLTPKSPLEKIAAHIGGVTIWRSSYLDIPQRTAFLKSIAQQSFLINRAIMETPAITDKFYQQSIIKNSPYLEGIPSYQFFSKKEIFHFLEQGRGRFPLIMKARLGSQGKSVFILKNKKEIGKIEEEKMNDYLFQNFIPNDGDYRVLVWGSKVLGMMKRTRSDLQQQFLNNISQGGKATPVDDNKIRKILSQIALKTASLFGLYLGGIDIIYNLEEKKYQILEINTVPQWRGLQKITPHDIARYIILECCQLAKRKKESTSRLISDYYETFFPFLNDKKFHYASRLFLWHGKKKNQQQLADLKKSYLGEGDAEKKKKLTFVFQNNRYYPSQETNFLSARGKIRLPYWQKYPLLKGYVRLLFKNMFASTIYHENLRPIIKTIVPDQHFLRLYSQLIKDRKAISILSTHAINYFYLLRYYLRKTNFSLNFSPSFFYQIAQEMDCDHNPTCLHLKIYLLTHCLIGESHFYSRPVPRKFPSKLFIKSIEKIIEKNFFTISLDAKLEFLVCSRIINYQSHLESLIYQEAERSLSKLGNFLVDRHNDQKEEAVHDFRQAEHRNVLYLISHFPYSPQKRKQ